MDKPKISKKLSVALSSIGIMVAYAKLTKQPIPYDAIAQVASVYLGVQGVIDFKKAQTDGELRKANRNP